MLVFWVLFVFFVWIAPMGEDHKSFDANSIDTNKIVKLAGTLQKIMESKGEQDLVEYLSSIIASSPKDKSGLFGANESSKFLRIILNFFRI